VGVPKRPRGASLESSEGGLVESQKKTTWKLVEGISSRPLRVQGLGHMTREKKEG
jgi:hypothetical protein